MIITTQGFIRVLSELFKHMGWFVSLVCLFVDNTHLSP